MTTVEHAVRTGLRAAMTNTVGGGDRRAVREDSSACRARSAAMGCVKRLRWMATADQSERKKLSVLLRSW